MKEKSITCYPDHRKNCIDYITKSRQKAGPPVKQCVASQIYTEIVLRIFTIFMAANWFLTQANILFIYIVWY